MGLHVSHGAFTGPYTRFNSFRQMVAKAAGGSYPPHEDAEQDPMTWYWDTDVYSKDTHLGLWTFLSQPDDHGEIGWLLVTAVAHDLEKLLPEIIKLEDSAPPCIKGVGGLTAMAQKFIAGCERSFESKEPLTFG